MKIFRITLFALLAALFAFGCTKPEPKNQRVVMIALDGLSVDGYLKAATPNLDALMAEGSLSLTTRDVMPSVTLPNWTSILTGSGPEVHGVVGNDWEITNFTLPAVETDEKGYFPSVFKLVKDQVPGVKTAFYYNWINLFYPYNEDYFDDVAYLENDQYVPYFERAFDFMVENRNSPSLMFLYSVHTDHVGHAHTWESSEFLRAIEEADVQIGILLDKMKAEGLYEDTHFMLLSDHGGINYGHGGVTTQEMVVPWGITGPSVKKGFTIEEPNNTVNTAPVILHIFGVEKPLSWTGEVIESIFE